MLNPRTGVINVFSIAADGSLSALVNTPGIPTSAGALVAQ